MLDIDAKLLLFEVATLLFTLFILNKILFTPLLSFIDDRNKNLKQDSDSLDENVYKIQKHISEANEILAHAKKEAASIKSDAMFESKKASNQKIEEKKAAIVAAMSEFDTVLAGQKNELKGSLLQRGHQYTDAIKHRLSAI